MKNINQKQLSELIALQQAIQANESKPTKKAVKKNTNAVFKVLVLIGLISATAYFTTGCSYHQDCDQTLHGRGNIPAPCRGVIYAGDR